MLPPSATVATRYQSLARWRVFRQFIWAVTLGLAATFAFGQTTVTADFAFRSGTTHSIPSHMFGFNRVNLTDGTTLSVIEKAGMTEVRVMANIPVVYAKSTPDWNSIDDVMKSIQAAGLNPMVTMLGSPPWLQPSPNPCTAGGYPAFNAPPTNVTEWANMAASYVAHLDARFPGLVRQYEIWNEPELPQSFCVADGLDSTRLSIYLKLYAAAASAMHAQATRDGNKWLKVGGPVIAKFSLASEWVPALLSDPATYPYVDFVAYHMYLTGPKQIGSLMNWSGLYGFTQSPTKGELFYYLQEISYVRHGLQPNAQSTPIYVSEFNDNWVFAQDCCRNNPTYGPLWNSVAVVDFLNAVYAGANSVPTKLFYFAGSASPYFCIAGKWNTAMDCNPSVLQLYPQYYAYELLASPLYLGLANGGHMAYSVSPVNTQTGLLATAFYTSKQDVVVIVNPTGTSYSGVKVVAKRVGYSSAVGKLYTLNKSHPNIASWSVGLTAITGGYQASISVPPYSTVALTIAP